MSVDVPADPSDELAELTNPQDEADRAALADLRDRIDQVLLGGPRLYTRGQIADVADVSTDTSRALWRALGFAEVGDDEARFTDLDARALNISKELLADVVIDETTQTSITRMLGQSMGRLAEWQGRLLFHVVAQRPEMLADPSLVADFVERIVPLLQEVQGFVWRRHLAAFSARALSGMVDNYDTESMVVGFADMTGFTSLTRRVSETELSALLEEFESVTSDVVTEHGGRIIKALGDEVMFAVESPAQAAEVGLTLSERAEADALLPELRVGMAFGQVLARYGDVYGSVVNIASRLTSNARPGYVLVDRDLADALTDAPAFYLRPKRPISVRGYSHLQPWLLRRARDRGEERTRRRRQD